MRVLLAFIEPTRLKLLFLAEWALYLLFVLARGDLRTSRQFLVGAAPFAFYYLVGCTLVALSRRMRPIVGGGRLLACALVPVLLDQSAKALVGATMPLGASTPLLPGWLDLTHAGNPAGSWLLRIYHVRPGVVVWLLQWSMTAFLLVLSVVSYRYYSATHRRSFWADVAFIGVFSAALSWPFDVGLRGYTLDFIGLPGHFAADLKDITIGIGAMAIFAEGLDNPGLDRGWPGWRGHLEQSWSLVRDVTRFGWGDLRRLVRGAGRGDDHRPI